jgi:hypothetical protein
MNPDTLKTVKYRMQYASDTDTLPIRSDTRIGKILVKYLFLNKKIIFDTRPIRPGTRIGKVSIYFLFLNKKIISDTICVF